MGGDEGTVTSADIARMAGVGRAAVSNWRRRYEDFPLPVGGTATSPTFSLAAVESWLLGQGKVAALPVEERVWQQIRTAADDIMLGEVVAEAAELLRGRARPALVPRPAVRLLRGYAAERSADTAVRFLLDRYADVNSRRLARTPPEVAAFMAELAGPDVRSVLDPACGIGTLPAAMAGVDRAYGQEVDGALARLARARLALAGLDAEVRAGDSLRQDAWPGLAVDAVVCHPPFNDRNWGYEELAGEPRWEYGLPPKSEPELAWVQHALTHLRPGGVAVLLMPAIAASRRSGRRIRGNLLRRGAVQAVIGLPPKAASGTGLPVHLWVLRRPTGEGRPASCVLMAEAEPAGFAAAGERWRAFRADPDRPLDHPGEARTVPIIDLIDEDVDLTPARYVGAPGGVPGSTYPAARAQFAGHLDRLPALLPDVRAGASHELPVVPLSELERTGALLVLHSGRYEIDGTGEPVLTGPEVLAGAPPAARTGPAGRIEIQPGDVVVAGRDREMAAVVAREAGTLLGPRLTLLRADPERLDPYFLAGFVRGLPAAAGGTQSGVTRFDARRAQVPRLPLDEQRRYGRAFAALFAFEAALREAHAAGRATAASLALGLADGSLTPPQA
ncbi:SAM-dependent methyltransferase [Sphaerisporangium rufum]|uniref:SAM-dependent methyltransferase n=2 Tax=Sphaerisporangium rufum TaxID=1381558 RepID=A0A919RC16_9ACTN|nr:SAM-dependent methyltransferase [Sphaerisporangium rufum]